MLEPQNQRPTISALEARQILEWHRNCSDSALGIKSNFGAFVSLIELGIPGAKAYVDPEEAVSDGLLRSVRRHRRIRDCFQRMKPEHRITLRSYPEPTLARYPAPVRTFFEDLSPLVVARHGMDRTQSMLSKGKSDAAYEAKSAARKELNEALEDFANAWTHDDDE
mgnify:CR=1 FL=1